MSMSNKLILGVALIFAVTVTSCLGLVFYYELQQRQLQLQETQLIQEQETERTEERSQFWQKLIPWGDDESEVN